MCTLTSPPCEFRLARGASPYLFLQSTVAGNKKIAKFAVLLRVSEDATLSTKANGGPAFELSHDSYVFLKETLKVVKVREAMETDYSDFGAIFAYKDFPPGHVPGKGLTRSDSKVWRLDLSHDSYKETRNDIETAIELARSSPGLGVYWIMQKDESKKYVKPAGMAIVSTRGVIVPGLSAFKFVAGA